MHSPINIVIADDSPIFLDGIRFMFSEHPEMHVSGTALHGQELLSIVQACSPAIVITDIQMPVMNGIEATRIIKQRFPTIGVIALTSFGEDMLIMDMLEAGASGYLLKTTSKEDLVSAINAVHAGENYFCKSTSKRLAEMISGRQSPSSRHTPKESLTEKEQHIIKLICEQRNTKEIAGLLNHSPKTIDAYRLKIIEKIGVQNTAGIVIYGIKEGLHKP